MAVCLIPNCRRSCQGDEPFCSQHRDRDDTTSTIATLVKALRFYADPIAYSMPVQDVGRHVFPDRGEVARAALKRTGYAAADPRSDTTNGAATIPSQPKRRGGNHVRRIA